MSTLASIKLAEEIAIEISINTIGKVILSAIISWSNIINIKLNNNKSLDKRVAAVN